MINLKIIPPDNNRWIKHFLLFDYNFGAKYQVQKFVPNSTFALVFHYKQIPHYSYDGKTFFPLSNIYLTFPFKAKNELFIKFGERIKTLVVVFNIDAIFRISEFSEILEENEIFVNISNLNNTIFRNIENIFHQNKNSNILPQIISLFNSQEITSNFVSLILSKSINYIFEAKGCITANELAEKCNITLRSLQRYYNQYLKVSPKFLIKTIRFDNLLNVLKRNNNIKIKEFVYDLNYCDYSHFIKEFKKISGETPSQYMKNYKEDFYSIEKFFSHK